MKKKIKIFIFCLICGMVLPGCNVFGKTSIPYVIDGEMTIEESADYDYGGLNLQLLNKSEKEISAFTIVFFLFDNDGNIPALGKASHVLNISIPVKAGDLLDCCINLDSYLYEIPEEPYLVDYLYVSRIVYSDGTQWSDPFGAYAFN